VLVAFEVLLQEASIQWIVVDDQDVSGTRLHPASSLGATKIAEVAVRRTRQRGGSVSRGARSEQETDATQSVWAATANGDVTIPQNPASKAQYDRKKAIAALACLLESHQVPN
jgi:hypothetical protein